MEIVQVIGIGVFTAVAAVITWLGIPGPFLLAGLSLIWGWVTGFTVVTLAQIGVLFGLALLMEGAEFLLGGIAARYYGAGRRAVILAIVGGIVGALIGAGVVLIGALVGLLVGAYLGAYCGERWDGKSHPEAARAAWGTVLGNLASKALKTAAVVAMGGWLIFRVVSGS
jgi:uncharacterized protein YqgC (DUF456 family)